MIHGIWVEGRPVPKGRPRFANGRVFTPKTTTDYENKIARAWWDKYGEKMLDGRLIVHVDVYSAMADRADVDNYLKTALDGLQGAAFENDRTVIGAKVVKVKSSENEGMRIAIFESDDIVSTV